MKHYYNLIRIRNDTIQSDIWHCTQQVMLTQIMPAYDFVIALDRKPRKAEIKEG